MPKKYIMVKGTEVFQTDNYEEAKEKWNTGWWQYIPQVRLHESIGAWYAPDMTQELHDNRARITDEELSKHPPPEMQTAVLLSL